MQRDSVELLNVGDVITFSRNVRLKSKNIIRKGTKGVVVSIGNPFGIFVYRVETDTYGIVSVRDWDIELDYMG